MVITIQSLWQHLVAIKTLDRAEQGVYKMLGGIRDKPSSGLQTELGCAVDRAAFRKYNSRVEKSNGSVVEI